MKLKELYSKNIARTVNPAVSATKMDDPETIRTEIEEYVFTDEIINGLFRILNAIKNNKPYEHVGIWIDGYYGSGKSHFLKYLDYCIMRETQDDALERLMNAIRAIDPMDEKHSLMPGCDFSAMRDIATWLKKATIDTCIFNLETSYDNSVDKKKAFLHIFWNEFNGKRGFNKFNLTLAQHLEKPLQEKGVFEQFKQRIAEEGGDWNDPGMAADMIDNELGMVLDIACELAPTLDKESIRERIVRRDMNVSIERFATELASYLKDKGDDYRLILLADEVSQFINKEKDRYLNLQEIITKLAEACGNRVWVACTAQQDLSEVMDDCHIAEEKDKEGKIKGRFEVKVSLKGTQPEVITQKRILDKKMEVKPTLSALYNKQKAAFSLQFKLPNSYGNYDSEQDFVDYYPFVPYQFKLIMQVFNSFLQLGYVAREVKGNERSIIKVVHSTAKACAEQEIGKFVSFDELYNNMFEEGLQAIGHRAFKNADDMARTYTQNPKLAMRVAKILFMICNISKNDQLLFPANIDNITSLLVNDIETPRLSIKNEVEKIVEFLCENSIIHREQGKVGTPDTFSFYSEEEMNIANQIKAQTVDNNTQAEQLREIFFKYLSTLRNKEQYLTRSFAVGATIKQRQFLSNSPDVVVEFAVDADYDTAEQLAVVNMPNRLVYYVGPQYLDNRRLFNNFYWYCQVSRYMATPASSEENAKIRIEFEKRAKEMLGSIIEPGFKKILDSCPIISGLRVMDDVETANKRGAERFHLAMQKHLAGIYTKAALVDRPDVPRTTEALRKAILRNINTGDYDGLNASLTPAEHEVEIYLNKQIDANVADVVSKFSKAPYGWDAICTLYVINELVRRHRRDYSYSNNPNVETSLVAQRLVQEQAKFTLRQAVAIPQDTINAFTEAWKYIFGVSAVFSTNDSTQLFRICHEPGSSQSINDRRSSYHQIEQEIGGYPFAKHIHEAIDLFDAWLTERDPKAFFEAVISSRDKGHELFDRCKEVVQFTHDHLAEYKTLLRFVKDNQYNFAFVPMSYQTHVEEFIKVETDEWPITGLRNYKHLMEDLEGILDEVRKDLREKITTAYKEQFDYLEKVCKEQDVPTSVLPERKNIIASKTTPENILVLKGNINTDAFYEEQIGVILEYVAKHKKKIEGGNGGDPVEKRKEKVRQVSLNTKTAMPLSTEEDIDRYLKGLKDQLTKLLVDYDSVMVIK